MTKRKTKNTEESALLPAQFILNNSTPRDRNSDLYRWAALVVERYESGRSIKNADDWLGSIMVGMDTEYLE